MIKWSSKEPECLIQDNTDCFDKTRIQTGIPYLCFYTISYVTSTLRQSHSNKLIMTLQI